MKLLGKVICAFAGHRRGREVKLVGDGVTDDTAAAQASIDRIRLFRCPRCGNETRYKIKPGSIGKVTTIIPPNIAIRK